MAQDPECAALLCQKLAPYLGVPVWDTPAGSPETSPASEKTTLFLDELVAMDPPRWMVSMKPIPPHCDESLLQWLGRLGVEEIKRVSNQEILLPVRSLQSAEGLGALDGMVLEGLRMEVALHEIVSSSSSSCSSGYQFQGHSYRPIGTDGEEDTEEKAKSLMQRFLSEGPKPANGSVQNYPWSQFLAEDQWLQDPEDKAKSVMHQFLSESPKADEKIEKVERRRAVYRPKFPKVEEPKVEAVEAKQGLQCPNLGKKMGGNKQRPMKASSRKGAGYHQPSLHTMHQ